MSRFVILLGGELHPTRRLSAMLEGSRIIAADSGMRHASALGVTPELWVGDFDSVDAAMRDAFAHVPTREFPPEKDKTDGELAIDHALEEGATELVLAGAFGGERADHAHLHLTQVVRLCEMGVPTMVTSGNQEGRHLATGVQHEFDYRSGTIFSILLFEPLSGLTVEGARWPLDHVEVEFGSSLTLSNYVADRLAIRLEKGRAMLVAHLNDEEIA
ncbi:thiamine diphosphokinase [Nitratireductor sp. CH_MIT9313-5]|uniref:thiamine diphosphokinase n=1 Tax=Nitratireductor sp. CH_MIT9313-5 TaxID=3107764 RepID=UPI003009F5B2